MTHRAAPCTSQKPKTRVGWGRCPRPPAVDDDGAGVGRRGHLHAADEGQQPRGVVGDTVLGPGREVELLHLVPGRVTSLQEKGTTA